MTSHHQPCPASCLTCAIKRKLLGQLALHRSLQFAASYHDTTGGVGFRAIAELVVDGLAIWDDPAARLTITRKGEEQR